MDDQDLDVGLETMFARLHEALPGPRIENACVVDVCALSQLVGLAAVGLEFIQSRRYKRPRGRPRGRSQRLDAVDQQIFEELDKQIRDLALACRDISIPTLRNQLIESAKKRGDLKDLANGSHEKRLREKWKDYLRSKPPTMAKALLYGEITRPKPRRKMSSN